MSPAKRRAPKGQGALKQRANGRWYWQQDFGQDPETGKRIRPTIERATRAEVVEARNAWLAGHASRLAARTAKPAKAGSVAAWVASWLPTVAAERSPNTYAKYELNVRLRIIPALGHLDLNEVTSELVEKLVERLTPATRQATLVTLGSAWTAAFNAQQVVDPGVIRRVTAQNTGYRAGRIPGLSAEEEDDAFLAASAEPDGDSQLKESMRAADLAAVMAVLEANRLRARWLLGLVFGLRQSEVAGLLWDDLTPDGRGGGVLLVRRSFIRPQYSHGCADTVPCGRPPSSCPRRVRLKRAKGTKSDRGTGADPGIRRIRIRPEMMRILLEWRDRQNEELAKLGLSPRPHKWMFTNRTGTPLNHRNDYTRWQGILKLAKVSKHYSLHHMRHTAASEAAALGLGAAELQSMFGWASPAMIENYVHSRDDRLDDGWDGVQGRFLPPSE